MGDLEPGENAKQTALERSRETARQLSVSARKLRFSTSGRSALYRAVGLRPRAIDRVFQILSIIVVVVVAVVPNLLSIAYFGFIASDIYQSEARFTVRPATPALGEDQIGSVSGLPSVKIVQDTQIVTNFMESAEALLALDSMVNLTEIYNRPVADPWARLGTSPTAEQKLRYWRNQLTISINPNSGIVTAAVRAFTAEDAQRVMQALLTKAEEVVNGVNDRIWNDVLQTARSNLDHASERLQEAQINLSKVRGRTGIMSVEASSSVISTLSTTIQSELLELEQRYNTQLQVVSADAPQMRALQREIEAKKAQLTELNAQIVGQTSGGAGLADVSSELARAQLEVSLAESQFAASVATYEQVQFVSRQQLLYLDAFLEPTLPQSPEFPRRPLWIGGIFVFSLLLMAVLLSVLSAWRNRVDR